MSLPYKIDGVDGVYAFPAKKVYLYASSAVTQHDSVALDLGDSTYGLGGSVEKSQLATTSHGALTCGVACETVAASSRVKVQVAGRYVGAQVANSTAAGDVLAASKVSGELSPIDESVIQKLSASTTTSTTATIAAADFNILPVAVALTADDADNIDGDADVDLDAGYAVVMIIDRGWF